MATQKQITANRTNSKFSTGPKGARSKRASALNAFLHGLSTPLIGPEHQQAAEAVANLIVQDCDDASTAKGVAIKILDYERNEALQHRQLVEIVLATEPPPAEPRSKLASGLSESDFESLKGFDFKTEPAPEGVSRQEHAMEMSLCKAVAGLLVKSHKQDTKKRAREAKNSLRYLRRSSNQLVKAVMAVAKNL